jgi:hypothetical protein
VGSTGCEALLYPAARAFGGAKESELKVSRQAFADMKPGIRSGSIVVYDPIVATFQGNPSWDRNAATAAVEFLRREVNPSADLASENHDISFEPIGKNQLKYENQRARLYAEWVGQRHPPGDYLIFSEILTDSTGETIVGGQIYIIDAAGRIAYSRHYNSHWFDPAKMPDTEAFMTWMLNVLLKDLNRDPKEVYPPYGVG